MIRNDRDLKVTDRTRIQRILNILEEVDMKSPQLIKTKDNMFWSGEATSNAVKEWFASFSEASEKYVREKSDADIHQSSAIEYIRINQIFLKNEKLRFADYLPKEFMDQIDKINFQLIIDNKANSLIEVLNLIKD